MDAPAPNVARSEAKSEMQKNKMAVLKATGT